MTTQRIARSKPIDAASFKKLAEAVRWAEDGQETARRATQAARGRHFAAGAPIVYAEGDRVYRKSAADSAPELVREIARARTPKRPKK